jgi:ubiquinone/menaquinone biosynthesis C-methylase UbiE
VSTFSRELIERSGYLEESFADVYDRFRPAPPMEVLEVIRTVARTPHPRLVVDLGCGTGLSARAWADSAAEIVGIEPNPQMLARARTATAQPNVRYVDSYASETGLSDGCADIVASFQAFHWMEPQPVLAEAARVLRDGGVFAACDYDVPPVVDPEVDEAFRRHFQARREARQRLEMPAGAARWPKERHVDEIRASGRFRYARELVAHGWWETDAPSLIGLAESIGGPRVIFGARAPEVGETFERLRETASRVLGERAWPLLLGCRIRVGIK